SPHITAFAPLGQRSVSRQVVLSTVMTTSSVVACSPCDPCMSCSSCPSSVGQASFVGPSACSDCAPVTGVPSYAPSNGSSYSNGTTYGGQATPQPQLTPEEASSLRIQQYPPSNGSNG